LQITFFGERDFHKAPSRITSAGASGGAAADHCRCWPMLWFMTEKENNERKAMEN
jgi:hypothetical protein